jgi:hypothetical protein
MHRPINDGRPRAMIARSQFRGLLPVAAASNMYSWPSPRLRAHSSAMAFVSKRPRTGSPPPFQFVVVRRLRRSTRFLAVLPLQLAEFTSQRFRVHLTALERVVQSLFFFVVLGLDAHRCLLYQPSQQHPSMDAAG